VLKRIDDPPPLLSSVARTFVRDVAEILEIETVRVTEGFVVDDTNESSLARVLGLRSRFVLLAPSELRIQKVKAHSNTCVLHMLMAGTTMAHTIAAPKPGDVKPCRDFGSV
jgi:hypothetical protein